MSGLSQTLRRILHARAPARPVQASEHNTTTTAVADEGAPPLCPTCAALDLHAILLAGVPQERPIALGPLTDILRKADACRFCRLLAAAVRRGWLLDRVPGVALGGIECALCAHECGCVQAPAPRARARCHRLYVRPSRRPDAVFTAVSAARAGLVLSVQLLAGDAAQFGRARALHGRVVGAAVDMRLVRRWVALCEGAHGDACRSVWWREAHDGLPACVRMVDVVSMAVVRAPPACRYVALSYLWGGMGKEYWTSRENFQHRAQPGGLDESVLPGTIRDAISFVRQLGERYLWVDALCIVQDDPEDAAAQIQIMDLIYGGSLLTVFAAGGTDASAPLPGLRPGTRTCEQHIEVVQGLHLAIPLPDPLEALGRSAWDTRGWTYQEVMLSRRRIYFTNQQVYFECCLDVWSEDLEAEAAPQPTAYHPLSNTGMGLFTSLRPPPGWARHEHYLMSYMRTVSRYTRRRLTMESDIINAATALMNALAKGFALGRGAFVLGMPVADLDHALLWQPAADAAHARRVRADGAAPWPSWAWAGWRGAVEYADDGIFLAINGPSNRPCPEESLVDAWFLVGAAGTLSQLAVRRITRAVTFPEEERGRVRYAGAHGRAGDPPQPADGALLAAGTLVFRTACATLRVAPEADGGGRPLAGAHHAVFSVYAAAGRAGRVILPVRAAACAVEFVVLSRGDGTGVAGLWDTAVFGEEYFGCVLYVMAVRPVAGGAVERIGVGVVVESAWLASSAEEKVVYLQ